MLIGRMQDLCALDVDSGEVAEQLPGACIQVALNIGTVNAWVVLPPAHLKLLYPRRVQLILQQKQDAAWQCSCRQGCLWRTGSNLRQLQGVDLGHL